ncbi:hypothetical protein HMPREF1548_01448 [Clostridium sp. KLE 1755]|nr:hypothetical protein HMPREF1548_01448 [Clostridium sp. KLE 1755]
MIQYHFFRSYPPVCAGRQLMAAVRFGRPKARRLQPVVLSVPAVRNQYQ